MPLARVNAYADQAVFEDGTLAEHLAPLPKGAPVVILVHGFKFSPSGDVSPHNHILSLSPTSTCPKALSWPRHLGFGRGDADEGLCIAFGWEARGTIWAARKRAADAGHALARLLDQLGDRPVHLVAHSLGARVVLTALTHARRPKAAHRVILLAAAALRSEAFAALASDGARGVELLNVTSRENDFFDAGFEAIVPARFGDCSLGLGLGYADLRWLDLQIDDATTLDRLRGLGFTIAGPNKRICHWSAYLRPGLFSFYTSFLRDPARLPLQMLALHLPRQTTPRWSRLFERPRLQLNLPFSRKRSF